MKRVLSILLICMMFTSAAFAANTSIVEYTAVTDEETGVTTVTATALANGVDADEVKLFTAVYNQDGSLAGAKKASTDDGLLLKNSVTYGADQTIKSFTWEGDVNTPVEAIATYGKTSFTEADVEITFGGKTFAEYVGSALAFDSEDHIAEYAITLKKDDIGTDGNIVVPSAAVKLSDNSLSYSVKNDAKAMTSTITIMSARNIEYDTSYTKPSAKENYTPAQQETIVISYSVEGVFTENMLVQEKISSYKAPGSYQINKAFSYDYTIPEGTYQDITINANVFPRSSMLVLVPKDKSKDVLAKKNDDNTYSEVSWSYDKTSKGEALAIVGYNYTYDDEGNITDTAFDASKVTAASVNTSLVSITKGGKAASATAVKNWTVNDGVYVSGTRVTAANYPDTPSTNVNNTRTTWISVPEEFVGCNYIISDHTSTGEAVINFSVNDNLDKIVVLTCNKEAATISTLYSGSTENPETYTEETAYELPRYVYQSLQDGEQKRMANFTLSYYIAKGTYTEESLEILNKEKLFFRRQSLIDFLAANSYSLDTELVSEELAALYTDYSTNDYNALAEYWYLGELIFDGDVVTEDSIALLAPATYTKDTETLTTVHPKILEFNSGCSGAYSDRLNYSNGAGQIISYPEWLEPENSTYIAGAYTWTSLPGASSLSALLQDTKVATDWYSITPKEDAVILMFTKNAKDNTFWATAAEGWTKVTLGEEDKVYVCRVRASGTYFEYNQLFVKNAKEGETVIIKSPMTSQLIPLVFVKAAN